MDEDYIKFGIVFRIDDLDSGAFYIGETTIKEKWDNDYLRSGSNKWRNHLKKHPPINTNPNNLNAHHYKRTILHRNIHSKKLLYDLELKEILKYSVWDSEKNRYVIINNDFKNVRTTIQGIVPSDSEHSTCFCEECGSRNHVHFKHCSKYKEKEPCEICGSRGQHKKNCLYYKIPKSAVPCPECGKTYGHHSKNCSLSNIPPCSECGGFRGQHYKTCSQYFTNINICPECGGSNGHYKICSKYKEATCKECGCSGGKHSPKCSRYIICKECGGKHGRHYKDCSKYTEHIKCGECGSSPHKKTCSKYTANSIVCSECGAISGRHYKTCSKYKDDYNICEECGNKTSHKKWCSKYKVIRCDECNGLGGKHYKYCSKYIHNICIKCGDKNGHHKTDCLFYKERIACKECGLKRGHKSWCSKSTSNGHIKSA